MRLGKGLEKETRQETLLVSALPGRVAPATKQPPECGEGDCPSGTVPGVHGPHSEQAEASGAHEMEGGGDAEEDTRVGEREAPEGLLR